MHAYTHARPEDGYGQNQGKQAISFKIHTHLHTHVDTRTHTHMLDQRMAIDPQIVVGFFAFEKLF